MVLCDLDGTLLYSTKKITERTKKALRDLRQSGILVGICSGRSAIALQNLIHVWGIENDIDFVLGFNGAMFWDPKTGNVEETALLDAAAVREGFEVCRGYGFGYAEYQGKTMLSTRDNPIMRQMARRNRLGFEKVRPDALIRPTLKFMAVGMPWTLSRWLAGDRPRHLKRLRVFRSGPFLLEFVHPSLSKLEGAKKAAEKYGIRLDEIVSFGNDTNDLEMLEGTIGVAMANALDCVKEKAKYITASNKKDGVALFIENEILPPVQPRQAAEK